MCIAIVNNGQKISKEAFKTSLQNNPDGFGMAYIIKNELKIFKSLSNDFHKLYKKYVAIYESTDNAILLHFRIGTSGNNDLLNCHPFNVTKNLALIHNGILDCYGLSKVNLNDTRHYIRDVLSHFSEADLIGNNALINLVSENIDYNKFCLLHANGKFVIYNEDLGHWNEDDNWYSNHSYKPFKGVNKAKWLGWYEDDKEDLKTDFKDDIICEGCNELKESLSFNTEYNIHICEDCKDWLAYEDKI